MTIGDMIRKVDAFNEVAKSLGMRETAELRFRDVGFFSKEVGTYREFKKCIKDEYLESAAKLILEYDGYQFGQKEEFVWVDRFGMEMKVEVEFFVTC